MIGKGIQQGSLFLPIRHLAGRAAATAPPKDYKKQICAVYNAIVNDWWRYTYDPKGAEVLTIQPDKIWEVTLGKGHPNHQGYGDCDDIATASGALLASIGFDVRIATTVKPGSRFIFDHVFIFVKPPRARKWICFDPVLFPVQGCGAITKFKRLAIWDLQGRLISRQGPFPPRFNAVMSLYGCDQPYIGAANSTGAELEQINMTQANPNFNDFYDYAGAMGLLGSADPVPESQINRLYSDDILPDFSNTGIIGFGAYAGVMGSTPGDQLPHIMAEYDETDEIGNTGLVRTKHFELSPDDYMNVQQYGTPRMGAVALADDGEFYQWEANPEGIGGFFKKLFKKGKKLVKRGIKAGKRFAKRIITKFPGGKLLWKIGGKLHRTAMKLTKTLLRVVGPIASRIAPIAALIPGIGPAVSAGLMLTGKAYKIAKKFGVKFDKNRKPMIKNKKQGRAYAMALAKEGQRMGKKGAKQAIEAYKRKTGGGGGGGRGGSASLIDPSFMGDASVYACPYANMVSRMPAYQGIGWA